jgi:(p)ppGpp synthase/HD superfamily hydrolase
LNDPDHILQRVTGFAEKAHSGQTRKYSPEPYIVHPVRVMNICKGYTTDITVLCAALLHDVLEDTSVSRKEISEFLEKLMDKEKASRTVDLVVELTDVYTKQSFPQYNRKKRKQLEMERIVKTSAGAQTVKYADILDNSREIVNHDRHFASVFLRECKNLLNTMNKGNQELYQKALDAVNVGLQSLHPSH